MGFILNSFSCFFSSNACDLNHDLEIYEEQIASVYTSACPTFGSSRLFLLLRRSMMTWIFGRTSRQPHSNSSEICNEQSCAIVDELLVQRCCRSYLLPLRSMMGGVRGPRSRCGEGDECFRSRLLSGRDRSLVAGDVLGNESILDSFLDIPASVWTRDDQV